ncbi:MAG: DUF1800 family protein [Henriciella sp.]
MKVAGRKRFVQSAALAFALGLTACGGGGGSGSSAPGASPPPPPPPPPPASTAFETNASTAHFLTQSTFGVVPEDVQQLTGTSPSDWILAEFNKAPSYNLGYVQTALQDPDARDGTGQPTFQGRHTPNFAFWYNAIEGDDQLRQRMAFALSQILVISNASSNTLFDLPEAVAYYQDILVRNAFGNYRDLLEEVTYSPAMGSYLTYLQNTKGDAATGRMPDENYAREIMQLFTIGLNDLNMDGSVITQNGIAVETYDNEDVTGLAKVFTGLSLEGDAFFFGFNELATDAPYSPMKIFPEWHSDLEKSFLGTTISAGTGAEESIDIALDTLVDHPNTPPFLARQLIQRFVTSTPDPAYIERVATAFADGTYTLPNGTSVGDGRRGDLSATIAAVLFDEQARDSANRAANDFGKIREPILRLSQWARTFDAGPITPEETFLIWNTSPPGSLAQGPYQAPSVFNFYRPGYVAPGTETGAAGLTMPELQLVNANTVSGYANFMTYFIFAFRADNATPEEFASFQPNYTEELALADNPAALVDHLDLLLTYQTASDETKATIVTFLEDISLTNPGDPDYDGPLLRVQLAILMMMTSPDYSVQR